MENNIKQKGKFSEAKEIVGAIIILPTLLLGFIIIFVGGMCGMGVELSSGDSRDMSECYAILDYVLYPVFGLAAAIISIATRNSKNKVCSIIVAIFYIIYGIANVYLLSMVLISSSNIGLEEHILYILFIIVLILLPIIGAIINILSIFPSKKKEEIK